MLKESVTLAEWLSCSTRTTKVLCFNLSATNFEMMLNKSLTAGCFGSPV